MKKHKRLILIALLCISFGSLVYFSVRLGINIMTKAQVEAFYSALPSPVVPAKRVPSSRPAAVTPSAGQTPIENGDDNGEETPEPVWTPALDFGALREEMPDLIAWLLIEGTPINYPIVHGGDNAYYLNHLPNRERNPMGSVFLDYRNPPDFSYPNSLIYGHYSSSGEMFAALHSYRTASFFENHSLAWIFTPEADYMIEIFAAYVVNSAYEVPPMTFAGDDVFDTYIQNIKRRSAFTADITVNPGDRLVSLATCEYSVDHGLGRLIVVGRIVD